MAFESRLLSGIGVISAVVEAGSFARAAEAMGLTQPAVSRAVARLEERIGIRIFHRTARAITLTEEGRRFYEAVAPHLASIEEAAISAGKTKAMVNGRLRVNVDGTFGHYVLAPRLNQFLDRYPDLVLEVMVRDRMGDLIADGFDVAVRFGEPEPSSLKARLLLKTRVLTCATKVYLDKHGYPATPKDLESHRCIMMRDPVSGRPFEWELINKKRSVDIAARGRLMVNDTGSLLGACLGGEGIAQLLELYAGDFLKDRHIVQVLPDWADETFPLYAYHHASHLVSAKVRAFLDFIAEIAKPPQTPRQS